MLQLGQWIWGARFAPQLAQKLEPSSFAVPQRAQVVLAMIVLEAEMQPT
ncbi:MAG: hypothetical protein ABIY55_04605 [Kofleriaceae bacterium]